MSPFLKKALIILTCISGFVFILSNIGIKTYAVDTPTPTPPPTKTPTDGKAPTTPAKDTTAPKATPATGPIGGERQNSTTSSSSFKECDFSKATSKASGSAAFLGCIKSVIQFVFVVSLFLVAIRIAVEALGSLNPFERGKAVDNSAALVKDIIFGLLILGAPSIFLNFLNPQTLQIDIINSISTGSGKVVDDKKGKTTTDGGVNSSGGITVPTAGGDISKKTVLEAASADPVKSKAVSDQVKLLADKANAIDGYSALTTYLDAVKADGGRSVLDSILVANNYQKSSIYTPNQVINTLTGDATTVTSADGKQLQLTFTTNPLNGIVVMPQTITLISNGAGCATKPPSGTIKAGVALGNPSCEYSVKAS